MLVVLLLVVSIKQVILSRVFKLVKNCFSVCSSRADVASSSRRIGAFFNKALAMEIRCRSPPESSEPFSPIILSHFSGSFSINSSQCASFAAASTLRIEGRCSLVSVLAVNSRNACSRLSASLALKITM